MSDDSYRFGFCSCFGACGIVIVNDLNKADSFCKFRYLIVEVVNPHGCLTCCKRKLLVCNCETAYNFFNVRKDICLRHPDRGPFALGNSVHRLKHILNKGDKDSVYSQKVEGEIGELSVENIRCEAAEKTVSCEVVNAASCHKAVTHKVYFGNVVTGIDCDEILDFITFVFFKQKLCHKLSFAVVVVHTFTAHDNIIATLGCKESFVIKGVVGGKHLYLVVRKAESFGGKADFKNGV